MTRMWRAALCAIGLGFVLCSPSWAQATSLESEPPGTYIAVQGPASVSGNAPLPIEGLPVGEYRLAADGLGLPAVKGRFVYSNGGIAGRSWTSPAALVLPPGYVHLGRSEKRGWLFLGAGAASATMSVISQARVRNSADDVESASAAYSRAVSEDEITNTRLALLDANRRRGDDREVRNLWLTYFALTWLGSGVESLFLTPQPTFTSTSPGQYVVALPRAGSWKAGVKSALVPGAGQRYMGRGARASFFGTATAVLAAATIVAHTRFLDARRDQARAQGRFDQAETEEETRQTSGFLRDAVEHTDRQNTLQWSLAGAAAGVYLWNVIDAFGLGRQAKVPALTISAMPTSSGVVVGASWSIP